MAGYFLGCFLLIHFASAYRHLSRNVCLLQLDEGQCLEDVPRFHYDTLTQRCTQFSYSGCGGNANNFMSYEACHKTCYSIPKIPRACRLPKEDGLCFGISKRYFFNMTTMRCEEFSYGGCGGNNNNFQDHTSCMEYCRPPKYMPVICHGGLDKGTGNASYTRYFYDRTTKMCKEFEYTGSGGNNNNFLTMERCRSICEKPNRSLRTRGQVTRIFRKRIE